MAEAVEKTGAPEENHCREFLATQTIPSLQLVIYSLREDFKLLNLKKIQLRDEALCHKTCYDVSITGQLLFKVLRTQEKECPKG